MRVFGISDLHLSFSKPKPMEKFGPEWHNHFLKIGENWRSIVSADDIVLIPGDISWALKYEEALPDLRFIADLPGRKVMIKGNHDYWWQSISKLRKSFYRNIYFIQSDVVEFEKVAISGTRLWTYPDIQWDDFAVGLKNSERAPDDRKIQRREIERLNQCMRNMQAYKNHIKILLTHFPPVGPVLQRNEINGLLGENGINLCAFGHLHGLSKEPFIAFDHVLDEVRYVLVSCDHILFTPKLLLEVQ